MVQNDLVRYFCSTDFSHICFLIGSDFNMLLAVGRFFEGVLVFMVIVFWIILKRTYYYLERTWLNYEKQN